MSADILHRAAALMRERAEKASAQVGPEWYARHQVGGYSWLEPAHISLHGYQTTAEHIASWHPAVALAVADLLARVADTSEAVGAEPSPDMLTVARAYLGESA